MEVIVDIHVERIGIAVGRPSAEIMVQFESLPHDDEFMVEMLGRGLSVQRKLGVIPVIIVVFLFLLLIFIGSVASEGRLRKTDIVVWLEVVVGWRPRLVDCVN